MMTQVFRGRTLADARSAAEIALGNDAVLLTTRKVPRRGVGGWLGQVDIEVSAASAAAIFPPSSDAPRSASTRKSVPPSSRPPARKSSGPFSTAVYRATDELNTDDAASAAAAAPPDATPSRDLAALRAEIRAVQVAISARAPSSPSSAPPPAPAIESEVAAMREAMEQLALAPLARGGPLARLIRARGIEGKAAAALSRALRDRKGDDDSAADAFRDALADLIHVSSWPLAGDEPKLIALVGPSGIGKTTTAAKMAAKAIIDQHKTVTFVACDASRVGAVEQLKRYAHFMEAHFEVASSPLDLQHIIARAKTDIVIVDTAGKTVLHPEGVEVSLGARGKGFREVQGRKRHVLLCVPASLRANDAEKFWRIWKPSAPTAIVVTKLDETEAPSGLLHATMASRLPVCALCFGHRVPEDIGPATTGAILDYLVPPGSVWRQAP